MTIENRMQQYQNFMGVKFARSPIRISELRRMTFFEAPASTHYHGAYAGGLFDHSLETAKALVGLTEKLGLTWERPESPYIVGMYHDLCKCNLYLPKALMRSNEPSVYTYNPDIIIPGHGEKSVIMIQKYMNLTNEEIACIRWHMGAFDDKTNWDYYCKAVEKYPNVLYTHTADMIASKIRGI